MTLVSVPRPDPPVVTQTLTLTARELALLETRSVHRVLAVPTLWQKSIPRTVEICHDHPLGPGLAVVDYFPEGAEYRTATHYRIGLSEEGRTQLLAREGKQVYCALGSDAGIWLTQALPSRSSKRHS